MPPKPAIVYPNATHLSPHLKWSEVQCPCGCKMPETVKTRLRVMAPKFEKLREMVGTPLNISPGGAYRCKKYNKSIGGAQFSQHMDGNALDVWSATVHNLKVADLAETVPGIGGVGRYITDRFTHIDQRQGTFRWTEE